MSEETLAASTVKSYPIVYSASMAPASRSGPFNLFGPRRSAHEMVQVSEGHYALIYRVDGKFVRDDSQDPRSDIAVRATHVSVVDIRRNAPIHVPLSIPAQKSQIFKLVATFGCTVKDPLLVVRLGLTDPRQLLANYLLGYHNIMQMGLDYRIDQINEVRRAIHDELTAYQTVHPPIIDGLEIQNASVDVIPPPRQVNRDEAELNEQDEHMLTMGKLLNQTQRELAQERAKNEKIKREADLRREQEMLDLDHGHEKNGRNVGREIWEEHLRQDAAIEAQRKLSEAKLQVWLRHREQLGEHDIDPADYIAVVDGGLSHAELAGQRREDRQAIAARNQQAEEEERKRRWEHEEEERKRRWAEEDHQRQVELKRLEFEHELAREGVVNERAKAIIQAQLDNLTKGLDQEAAQKQRESVVTIIGNLASRGHLDMMDLDLESLIKQLGGPDAAKALDAAAGKPAGIEKGDSAGGSATESGTKPEPSTGSSSEPDAAPDAEPGPEPVEVLVEPVEESDPSTGDGHPRHADNT